MRSPLRPISRQLPVSPLLTGRLLSGLLMLSLLGCSGGKAPQSSIEVASKGAQSAALSDDGQYISIGSIHHGGSLWRTNDGERLYNWNHKQGAFTTIVASDFSPDGRWALTSDLHTLVLWDMKDGQALRFWTAPGDVLSIALSNDGNFALLGLADHSAVLFDVKRGGIKRTFHHKNRVRSVDLSEDGRLAITGSEDYTAAVWDVASGKRLHQTMFNDDVQIVVLSPDGKLAMSAAKYDKALLWDTGTGQSLGEIPLAQEKLRRGVRFTAAKFSLDGRSLLTGRPDRIIQLWDTHSLNILGRWQVPKRDAWKPTSASIIAVGFGERDGNYLAVSSNGFVHQLSRD